MMKSRLHIFQSVCVAWLCFLASQSQADTWNVTASQDAHVSSFSATTSFGTATSLVLGCAVAANTSHYRALVQFSLPANLTGATVNSATLQMTGTNTPASIATNMRASRITGSWSNSVTWDTQPTVSSTDYRVDAFNTSTTGAKTLSWDVTTLVQSFANGSANLGFLLRRDPESVVNGYFIFNASENTGAGAKPTLVINYTPIVTVPLPAPVISVNTSTASTDLTDTSAVVRWTWSGSTANSTSITVTVRDMLTDTIIVSDASVSDTATSYSLTSLNSANLYRVNVAYKPSAGYSQGSQDYEFYTRLPAPDPLYPISGAYDGPPAQLGWQPYSGSWTMAYGLHISTTSSGFSSRTGFSSPLVNVSPSIADYTWGGGTIGQTYWWSARQYSSTGAGPSTSYFSTPRSFIYGAEPNLLGLDVSALNGKKVRGPIFLGAPSTTVTIFPWIRFYIRRADGTPLAETYVGGAKALVLNDTPWRKPDGTYVAQWSDIISLGTSLTVVGVDSLGQEFPSSTFTVTPQTALTATLTSGTTFPTFTVPITPTFTGLGTGGTGSPQYSWYYRSTTPVAGATFNPTFSQRGSHVVTLKVTDSNNNVTFAQYVAPVAYRLTVGNPAMNGGGSTLVGPVDVVSGNLHLSLADHAVPSFGVPFTLTRSYNIWPGEPASRFWRFNVEEYAISGVFTVSGKTFAGRSLFIYRADGTKQEYYINESGAYVPLNPGSFDVLVENGIGSTATLKLYEKDGTERTFSRSPIIVADVNANVWMLTSVKSPRGQGLTITHDSASASHWQLLPRILKVTDAANRDFSFTYDGSGRISRVDDPTGLYVTYTWDANHNITASRDVRGNFTNYTYHVAVGSPGEKRLQSITRPRGNSPLQNVVYDGSGRVTSFSDGDGFTTSFDYTSTANATIVTPPISAEKLKFIFDSSTRAITSVIEAFGTGNFTTTLTNRTASANNRIADYGLLQSSTDTANRQTDLTYLNNTRGQIESTTEPGSRTTTYAWQDINTAKNISTVTNVSTPFGRSYGATPNAYGEITGTTDPANNASSTVYNSKGLPSSTTDALNRTTSFSYDATYGNLTLLTDHTGASASIEYLEPRNGRPTRRTDRRGFHTDYTYDAAGNILTVTDHMGGQIINTYDTNGNLATTRDRRGNITTLTYNNRDLTQTMSRTAPVNGTSMTMTEAMSYDGMGRVQSSQNARGNTTYRYYNSRGLLSSIVNGEGETVLTLTYNSDGTVSTQQKGTSPSASTVTFGYDTLGRQISVTDSLGNQVQMTYNSDNQVTGQRDARGNWTYFTYDTAARLATVTDTGNATTRAFYDAIGRLTEVRDPRGNSTFYAFDDPNRRITESDHLSRSWINTHDAEGNLITEAYPDGRTFSYTYDSLGRLDYLNYTGGRFADPSYDADGNIISLADHLGTTSYNYDSMSRLGSVTDPFGQTVSYLYDAASNISRISYPGSGKLVNYTFDNAERMKTVAPWAGGTFTYTWRSDSMPSRITNGNTTYTDYGYDAAARLTSLVTRYSSGTAFITQNFTLDANGNITRILGDQPTAPPADAPKLMTYEATNRLVMDATSTVSHDAAGRITGNPSATGGAATWEGRDWLASYTPTGGSPSSYSYNGLGQRLSRTQGGSTTRYVQNFNQSLPAVLMENNASNVAQRYYIHGLGLLASIDSGGTATTYHFNHRGDTLALTNPSQTITESYGYSPYGLTAASNVGSSNPFRFTGQLGVMDEGNGLHFMRARFYAAGTGRFLSIDQKAGSGMSAQTLNRFAFVTGNPLSYVDPSGLSAQPTLSELESMLAMANTNANNREARANKFKLLTRNSTGDQRVAARRIWMKNASESIQYKKDAVELEGKIASMKADIEERAQRSMLADRIGTGGDIIELAAGAEHPVFGMVVGGYTAGVNAWDQYKGGDNGGAFNTLGQFGVCDVGAPFLVTGLVTTFTGPVGPLIGYGIGSYTTQGCNWALQTAQKPEQIGYLGSYTATWTK